MEKLWFEVHSNAWFLIFFGFPTGIAQNLLQNKMHHIKAQV
jgi:hypothetical protein